MEENFLYDDELALSGKDVLGGDSSSSVEDVEKILRPSFVASNSAVHF